MRQIIAAVLTLAQIHAALAYYHANRDEIERDLTADKARASTLENKNEPPES